MKVLGYGGVLSADWIDALVEMMREAGDFEGGLRLKEARDRIAALMQGWQELFVTPAGQRLVDEAVNGPLRILAARASGLELDLNRFYDQMNRFMDRLLGEVRHIDMLLSRIEAERWRIRLPALPLRKVSILQDLSGGLGSVSPRHEADPATGSAYWLAGRKPAQPGRVSVFRNGSIVEGVAPAWQVETVLRPISFSWTVDPDRQCLAVEELQGNVHVLQVLAEPESGSGRQEAEIRLLAPASLSGSPVAAARGVHRLGILPVYVRIGFRQRRSWKRIAFPEGPVQEPVVLTPFRLSRDDLFVIDGDYVFQNGVDYVLLEEQRAIRAAPGLAGRAVDVRFTEFWPAYQCSLNNEDWSDPVFLDAEHPFPPGRIAPPGFEILRDADGTAWFPVLDESGAPVGSYFRMLVSPETEYLFRVAAPSSVDPALRVRLEMLLDRAAHVNRLHLDPRSSFPVLLDSIYGEGLVVGQTEPVFHGPALIDRPVSIPLATDSGSMPYVRRLFLNFRVPTYKIKHHEVSDEAQIRADAWARVAVLMPRQFRRRPRPEARKLTGWQYEIGFSEIRAERVRHFGKGVISFGPYPVPEMSQLLRLDVQADPDPESTDPLFEQLAWYGRLEYLSSNGEPQFAYPQSADALINPGQTMRFADVWTGWSAPQPLPGRIWLYCVFRSPGVVLRRFYLQVA